MADPFASPAAVPSADTALLLEVQINGQPSGKIGEFVLHRGHLMARASELHDLGLQIPLSRTAQADGLIALADLPGITWVLDEQNQVIKITAPNAALTVNRLLVESADARAPRKIESGNGLTINDDVVGSHAAGKTGASGLFDIRAFSQHGILSTGLLAYAGSAPGYSGKQHAIRLDTAYSFADVNTLRRYTAGDFITSSLSWTRAVRLEGLQLRSDFSMRPDLVTFPMPVISGAAAVPSTVNILTDGNQALTQKIEPGPFEIPQLPVVSGAGTISMTVTNALGQQVTVSQPFYASASLLAPGLQTFSGQLGVVRLDWGTLSNSYGKPAGVANYRRGLTRILTLEGSAEGTSGAVAFGGGGVLQVSHWGVINLSVMPSFASAREGAQASFGAQRIGRTFSIGGSAILASRMYRDVAAMNGSGVVRRQYSGFASYSFRRYGSAALGYAEIKQDTAPTIINAGTSPLSRVFTVNYSVQIHHASFYATGFKNFTSSSSGANGVQVGMTFSYGRNRTASLSGDSSGNRQVAVQQSAPQVDDWGYNVYASDGDTTHTFAQAQYKSRVGLFTAGVDRTDGATSVQLESQGSVSFVDKSVFAANQIYDSFAVVDTWPATNVRVYQENRPVGTTGRSGRVLVPDMRSFDLNHISIEPTDVPPDASLSWDKSAIRPQDRSGVIIKFPIRFSHSALLRLVDEAGAVVPQGSTATLVATKAVVPVGYEGQAYLEDLGEHNEVSVEYPNGKQCVVKFRYQATPGDIPSLGPLRCVEKRP